MRKGWWVTSERTFAILPERCCRAGSWDPWLTTCHVCVCVWERECVCVWERQNVYLCGCGYVITNPAWQGIPTPGRPGWRAVASRPCWCYRMRKRGWGRWAIHPGRLSRRHGRCGPSPSRGRSACATQSGERRQNQHHNGLHCLGQMELEFCLTLCWKPKECAWKIYDDVFIIPLG